MQSLKIINLYYGLKASNTTLHANDTAKTTVHKV